MLQLLICYAAVVCMPSWMRESPTTLPHLLLVYGECPHVDGPVLCASDNNVLCTQSRNADYTMRCLCVCMPTPRTRSGIRVMQTCFASPRRHSHMHTRMHTHMHCAPAGALCGTPPLLAWAQSGTAHCCCIWVVCVTQAVAPAVG